MAKFYSVSIVHEYAFVLSLDKRDDVLEVLSTEELELSELAVFLKNKKNLHISIEPKFELSQNIEVPAAIAGSSNVKNYLLYKIKEENPSIDALFTYKKLPQQNDEENITYYVEVVDEKEYLETLNCIDDLSEIKVVTSSKFALLSLANKCIEVDYFICVYTTATMIIVLAIEQKKMLFSRKIIVESSSPQTMQMEIVENITQTISYINNKFRDIDFKTLVLGGSIALDDVIPQHIATFNNMAISILYPNTFVKNLDAEESQNHILSLGTAFVEKQHQFLLKKILGLRQFNLISNVGLVLSSLLLFGVMYFMFIAIIEHNTLAQKNEILKDKYLKVLSHTKMLAPNEVRRYTDHIYLVKKYLKNSPIDVMIELRSLIELQKPSKFEYKDNTGSVSFHIVFNKTFHDLMQLYKFQEEFDKRFNAIKFSVKIDKKIKADYKKLNYEVELQTVDRMKKNTRQRRRR